MSKHIAKEYFYHLPSGNIVHPCRLIHKDGTLMWKHALLFQNQLVVLPDSEAVEVHIIKTAQRLEELNSWVSQDLEPWECLTPYAWYVPFEPELADGISVYFQHTVHNTDIVFDLLKPHIHDHETLDVRHNYIFFKRC